MKKKRFLIVPIIFLIAAIIEIIGGGFGIFDHFLKKKEVAVSDKKYSSKIINVTSYNQSGGITAYTVNVNQQKRAISSKANIKKWKKGNDFVLQIILNQTSGVWDPSTVFKMKVKTSGAYKTAGVVKGMPIILYERVISEDKQKGFFSFSTRTAPLENEPIVFEFLSTNEIDIVQLSVEPLSKK